METLFKGIKGHPVDTLIPLITKHDYEDEPVAIHLLYKGSDFMLREFRQEDDSAEGDYNISLKGREVKKKPWKDLVLRLKFYYKTGNPLLEAVVPGDREDLKRELVEALSQVDKLHLYLADSKNKLLKVKRLQWGEEGREYMRQLLAD